MILCLQLHRWTCSWVFCDTACAAANTIAANGMSFESKGLLRELNPGPLAPEARIIPLDQAADEN